MKPKQPTDEKTSGMHNMHPLAGQSRKNLGQTEGQNAHDAKKKRGQFGGAGDAPLIKK